MCVTIYVSNARNELAQLINTPKTKGLRQQKSCSILFVELDAVDVLVGPNTALRSRVCDTLTPHR